MKKFSKIKSLLIFTCAIYLFGAPTSTIAKENNSKPYKVKVSPSYVEELKTREKQKSHKATNKANLEANLVDISGKNLIDILDNKPSIKAQNIPIPQHKPITLNKIEPAGYNSSNDANNIETTLVSFVVKPEQIGLDKNLELFLKKHAINLLNRDENLKMSIRAYATEIDGQPHSDVRISLARALEVRSFLIKNQINPSRIKLNPKGKSENNEINDRIDLIFIKNK